jgi:hypothetical protein
MEGDEMKAIDRLNEWLNQIPEQHRGKDILQAANMLPWLKNHVKVPGMERMLAAATTVGDVRVAYTVPAEITKQLAEIPFDSYSNIDGGVIHFPHKTIFIFSQDESGKAWEFFIGESHGMDATGEYTDLLFSDWDVSTVLTLFPGHTVGDCIKLCLSTIQSKVGFSEDFARKVDKAMEFIVKLSLFLTATNDYEDITIPAIAGGKRNRNKPSFLKTPAIDRIVGGKFIGALRLWKHKTDSCDSSLTGRTVRPHVRAGHFHLYWTGKGRTIPKVQFLHPCLVNADSVGDVEIQSTVIQ